MTDHKIMQGVEAAPVHITGSDIPLGRKPRRCVARYETYVLTANDPTMCILPENPDREIAFVQAIDNDIVLGPTKAVVGAAQNTVTSVPNPNGTYLPKANTVPYPVLDSNAVYAGVTTTSSSSRVSVTDYFRALE